MQQIDSPTSTDVTEASATLDPRRILEAVVTELEMLRDERPTAAASGLIDFHGALLLYELQGRAELLPAFSFPTPGRRFLEFRVVTSARRLAGKHRGAEAAAFALVLAAERIERLIHLIDPELRSAVAA